MSYPVVSPPAAVPLAKPPGRPATVTAASALLWAMAAAGLFYAITTVVVVPGAVARFRDAVPGTTDPEMYIDVVWLGAAIALALGIIIFALFVVLGIALRRGSNASRRATLVVCVLGVLGGLIAGLTVGAERSGVATAGSIGERLSGSYPGGWVSTNVGVAVAQVVAYLIVGALVLAAPKAFFGHGPRAAAGGAVPGATSSGHNQPSGFAAPPAGYGSVPAGYGTPPAGYGPPAPGYTPGFGPTAGYAQPGHGPGAGHAPPGYASPGYAPPGYAQPGAQPGYAQPGYAQPGYSQSGYAQPGYAQPGQGQPAYGPSGQGQPAYGPSGQGQPAYGPSGQGQPAYGPSGQGQPAYGPSGQGPSASVPPSEPSPWRAPPASSAGQPGSSAELQGSSAGPSEEAAKPPVAPPAAPPRPGSDDEFWSRHSE